jgi:hypothetical protein
MVYYELLSDVRVLLVKPEEPLAFTQCPMSACQQTDSETMFRRVTIPNGFPYSSCTDPSTGFAKVT